MSVQEQFAEVAGRNSLPVLAAHFALAHSQFAEKTSARPRLRGALKRMLDLAVGAPALALLLPLMLVVALLIRLDSAGPIIFRQKRLGLCGKPFTILKFRTMHVVEDGDLVVQVARSDARITRFGAVLRAASLDELPQLINVLKGDMSLVGPRPHAIVHDVFYARMIPEYALRQRVKPGITGWAQINGLRGGTPTLDLMQRRIDMDLWYADRASIALDLLILLRTPLELLRRRDAY